MGVKAIVGRPDGDHSVIMGPNNEQVNAGADKDRQVPAGPYVTKLLS